MKFPAFIVVTILMLTCSYAFSQQYDAMSIKELQKAKNQAVQNEEYAKAHKLKTIIELKEKIQTALASENYLEASNLKKQLEEITSGNSTASTATSSGTGIYDLEFYNTIYVHNAESGSQKLEKKTAEIRTSSYSAVVVAGSSSFWEVDGFHSSTQINNESKYTFLVRVANGIDPSTLFKLNRLEIVGNNVLKRSLLSFKTTAAAYAGASTSQNKDHEVPISFKKVSDEVYEIIIEEVIPPGEYAFVQGNNWYLFGTKNQFTNAAGLEITDRVFTDGHIYDKEGKYGRTAWLGYDYSLLKIKTANGSGDQAQLERALTSAMDKINTKYLDNDKEIGILLRKEKGMMWNPLYINGFMQENAPASYFIPANHDYAVTDEMIAANLNKYDVNYPELGLIVIPEIMDIPNKELRGRVIWFDFDTREIIYSISHVKRIDTTEKFKERDVWADLYDFLKESLRGEYDDNYKRYN